MSNCTNCGPAQRQGNCPCKSCPPAKPCKPTCCSVSGPGSAEPQFIKFCVLDPDTGDKLLALLEKDCYGNVTSLGYLNAQLELVAPPVRLEVCAPAPLPLEILDIGTGWSFILDGSSIGVIPKSTAVYENDGTVTITTSDGSVVSVWASTATDSLTCDDNGFTHVAIDGTVQNCVYPCNAPTVNTDGSLTFECPDGTVTNTDPKTRIELQPDGTVLITDYRGVQASFVPAP